MKKYFLFTLIKLFLIILTLLNADLINAQDTTNIRKNTHRNDTNFRYGNTDDVPGAKQIIYGSGKCAAKTSSGIIRDNPPITEEKRDSIRKRRNEYIQSLNEKSRYRHLNDTLMTKEYSDGQKLDTLIDRK